MPYMSEEEEMITTLTGENSFLLQKELKMLITDFVAQYTDMGLERLDGQEVPYDRMREALESLPFLASKKLVVLDQPSANKEFVEKVESLLSDVAETTEVVIVEPKPDKRTSYFKFLKKNTDVKTYDELDEQGLANWLVAAAKERNGSISLSDARYLVNRAGASQQLLSNELEKLLNYRPELTRSTIDLLTDQTPQSTIFELLDAAMVGNTKKALQLYEEQRALRVEPHQIIAMLGWQLHVLAVVKTAGERDAGQIAKEVKINPYVVRKSQALARHLSLGEIKQLVHDALALDIRLKTEPVDADDALEHLLLNIGAKT